MSFNCVLCTIALGADGREVKKSFQGLPIVGAPYGMRGWVLRTLILPWLGSMGVFEQIVVSGEWEDGPHYKYVPVPPVYHNIGDLFIQRQAAFDALAGTDPNDWVLYLNDDTIWDAANRVPSPLESAGVLSPSRWTRGRYPRGERLNDGSRARSPWNDDDYVNLHGVLVKRGVTKRLPWTTLPPVPQMDVALTTALRDADIPWRYAPDLRVWDVEIFGEPWK